MTESPDFFPASGGRRFDRYASMLAVVFSLAALFVAVAEVNSERAQQRASVWPHIEISEAYSEAGFTLRMTNKGVGPALMGRMALTFDGKPVTDLDQLILDTIGAEKAFSYERYGMSDPSNGVLAPSDEVRLFTVDWDDSTRELIQAWNGRIDIVTCYCSINNDCWQTSLTTESNTPIDSCRTGVSL